MGNETTRGYDRSDTAGVFTDATRATDQRTLGSVSDFSERENSTSSYPI